MKSHGRRSHEFHLIIFKPNRFLHICPVESYQVEAKRLFEVSRNGIDGTDGSA
jgi:hypothetical protein